MSEKDDTPIQPEITMVDIIEEIKDLAEIMDIVHSELSDIKAILLTKKETNGDKPLLKESNKKTDYMHG
tara:strand:- start:1037 stop:1243 length:207 start_codon:yes stop_codon:yes gene_type:complete